MLFDFMTQNLHHIITYHHGNTKKITMEDPWILVVVILSSHLDGPRYRKRKVNQNVPQWIIENIIVKRYVIIFPSKTLKKQWTLALLIHSWTSSQEGLHECRRPSDLSGCYLILPPRCEKARYFGGKIRIIHNKHY